MNIMRDKNEKNENGFFKTTKAIKGKTLTYITGALGLVAGLAWNDAVKSLIESIFPSNDNTLLAKFLYALGVTLIVAIIIAYLETKFKDE